MDFSAVHEQQQTTLSPTGSVVIGTAGYRLLLRHPLTLALQQVYNCLDQIDHVEPSPDGEHVLCVLTKKSVTQVWSVRDSNWTCRIDEGLAGLETAFWIDDRHVMTIAGFMLHATIWSLVDRTHSRVRSPKTLPGFRATAHAARGLPLLAVASRKECKDLMTIYEFPSRACAATFAVASEDLADFAWGPHDSTLLVWDSPLDCLMLVYSLRGEQLQRFNFYSGALGVKKVLFSPGFEMVAIGCHNQEIRLLNTTTWTEAATLSHPDSITLDSNTVVYREEAVGGPVAAHVHRHGGDTQVPIAYVAQRVESRGELQIPSSKTVVDGQPKVGVGLIAWSPNSRFVACRNDSQPLAAYIWDTYRVVLAAVCLHRSPVADVAWDPAPRRAEEPRLLIATRERRVFIWSERGGQVVDVPSAVQVGHVFWRPDGLACVLASRAKLVVAFPSGGQAALAEARAAGQFTPAAREEAAVGPVGSRPPSAKATPRSAGAVSARSAGAVDVIDAESVGASGTPETQNILRDALLGSTA